MKKAIISAFAFSLLFPFAIYATALVNINTADKNTLMTLNGIGTVKAQAIIDYRTQHGPFATVGDIQNVSGIGPATYANIKDFITVSDASPPAQDTASSTSDNGSASPAEPSAPVQNGASNPVSNLMAFAGDNRTVITGADTLYTGAASTKNGTPLLSSGVRFLWNFGDGSMSEGASVMHHFAHPGRYAVVLDVTSGVDYATRRTIVDVEDAALGISYLDDGSAVIENDAGRDLDLSYWTIAQGEHHLSLPQDTVVLRGEKIIVPPATLGFAASAGWELLYPNGDIEGTASAPKPRIIHAPATPSAGTEQSRGTHSAAAVPPAPMLPVATTAPTASAAEAVGNDLTSEWMLGLIALTFLGAGGLYFAWHARTGWTIIEQKP